MPRSIAGVPTRAALAGGLQIRPGDRVAYLGYNSPVVLELLFACARLGAIFVPLNWRLTAAEHRVVLGDAEPSALSPSRTSLRTRRRCAARVPHLVACGPPAARDSWHRYEDLTAAAEAPLGGAVTWHRRSSSSTRRERPGGRKAPC
jgi:acyl-CoA synthetase (AMP-forming)/AMP-acid ligase II